jgi:hypothetical protein
MPTCCICYEKGKHIKSLLGRHVEVLDGGIEPIGFVKGLKLCDACHVKYTEFANAGTLPVTLVEDRDRLIAWYEWTAEPKEELRS